MFLIGNKKKKKNNNNVTTEQPTSVSKKLANVFS